MWLLLLICVLLIPNICWTNDATLVALCVDLLIIVADFECIAGSMIAIMIFGKLRAILMLLFYML